MEELNKLNFNCNGQMVYLDLGFLLILIDLILFNKLFETKK